ncbi:MULTISPECIES: FHA domain-containing protein [Alteromonadaceae]|uniref:FHA domain-containing protein n=1 Tax=Alteromonadaceae TaxID=72275 RepID=UPI0031080221
MFTSDTVISVGRCAQTNDVHINDPSVSRNHLQLRINSLDFIEVRDCGSSYGSFYWEGSQWLQFDVVTLSANDYIVVGETKLRIMEIMIAYQIKSRSRGI